MACHILCKGLNRVRRLIERKSVPCALTFSVFTLSFISFFHKACLRFEGIISQWNTGTDIFCSLSIECTHLVRTREKNWPSLVLGVFWSYCTKTTTHVTLTGCVKKRWVMNNNDEYALIVDFNIKNSMYWKRNPSLLFEHKRFLPGIAVFMHSSYIQPFSLDQSNDILKFNP